MPEKTDDFGDDFLTPEHLLHGPVIRFAGSPEELAGRVSQGLVRYFRDPENLAGMSGATLLPLIVFRGRKVPFLPLFLVALMGEYGGRLAYRASENLKVIAQASAGQVPEVSCTQPHCTTCYDKGEVAVAREGSLGLSLEAVPCPDCSAKPGDA